MVDVVEKHYGNSGNESRHGNIKQTDRRKEKRSPLHFYSYPQRWKETQREEVQEVQQVELQEEVEHRRQEEEEGAEEDVHPMVL